MNRYKLFALSAGAILLLSGFAHADEQKECLAQAGSYGPGLGGAAGFGIQTFAACKQKCNTIKLEWKKYGVNTNNVCRWGNLIFFKNGVEVPVKLEEKGECIAQAGSYGPGLGGAADFGIQTFAGCKEKCNTIKREWDKYGVKTKAGCRWADKKFYQR